MEIEAWPRCVERKENHRIALYVILAVLFIIAITFTYLKRAEIREKNAALIRMKIERGAVQDLHVAREKLNPQPKVKRLRTAVTPTKGASRDLMASDGAARRTESPQ